MAAIEASLFTWRDVEARSDPERFHLVRDHLPDERLVRYPEVMLGQAIRKNRIGAQATPSKFVVLFCAKAILLRRTSVCNSLSVRVSMALVPSNCLATSSAFKKIGFRPWFFTGV